MTTDFPRLAWINIADELSADPAFLDDADPTWVAAARSFASEHGLFFPPPADVDLALEMARPRCVRCGGTFTSRDERAEVADGVVHVECMRSGEDIA